MHNIHTIITRLAIVAATVAAIFSQADVLNRTIGWIEKADMGNLLNLPIGNIVMDWDGKTPSTKVDEEIVRLSVPRKWSDDGPFDALRVTDILFDTKSLVIKDGMSSYVYPTIEAGAFAMTNTIFKAVGKASDKKAMVVPAHVNNDEGCMEMTYFWDAADGRKLELLVRGYGNHAGQFALCSLLHTKGDGIMPKMQPRQNSDGNNTYEERNMTGDAGNTERQSYRGAEAHGRIARICSHAWR